MTSRGCTAIHVSMLTFVFLFSGLACACTPRPILATEETSAAPQPVQSVYALVLAGKECGPRYEGDNSISCTYKVGNDLRFSIDGVGEADAGVTFLRSSFDGDYYATFGILHGCVIVKQGKLRMEGVTLDVVERFSDYAFVSPKNGKVYRDWNDCRKSN